MAFVALILAFRAHSRFFPEKFREERLGTTLATAPLQALGPLSAKVPPPH